MAIGKKPVMTRIRRSELAVGQRVRWDIYDSKNNILVEKGTILKSEADFVTVGLSGDIFRIGGGLDDSADLTPLDSNIFDEIDHLELRMRNVLRAIYDSPHEVPERIQKLAERIYRYVDTEPDACIGIAHLYHEGNYTELHPLHVAILALVVAQARQYTAEQSVSLASAALSKHLSVARLQEDLHSQTQPLSIEQRTLIQSYPQKSFDLLQRVGVKDEDWLRAVLECQENEDGTGYPKGLQGHQISEMAKIIALADRYSAMTSDRNYKKADLSSSVLKRFFQGKGTALNEELTLQFIKELGVYPPGTFVKLSDGYVGVVIGRGAHASKPKVSCYQDQYGRQMAKPVIRNMFRDPEKIAATLPPQDIENLNLKWIWGYMFV
ncbi:MAG: hypothetical protein HUJ30_09560 [Gammaproteobacteria bacterium]|nr:hypothetical protein [Gammaproteobacteria bacterium]